jgi:hypothetical protein
MPQVESVERPFHAHEEQAGLRVLMLVGMGDVGAETKEQAGNARHQAFAVGTVDQQDGGIGHAGSITRRPSIAPAQTA